MTVSVIIPTYNRAHCLARALDSVLAQSLAAHEIIVVDDGSTDNTAALLAESYPMVTLIQQNNQGVSAARNRAIEQASGEWIALLDSDDAWVADKLAQQVSALSRAPEYQICHTEEIWIRRGQRVNPMKKHQKRGGWIFEHCLALCCISPSSVMIARSVFEAYGVFNESLPACEDYDLWLRLCAVMPVLFIETPLTIKHGGHDDQLSTQYWGMDRFRIDAISRLLENTPLTESDAAAARQQLANKIDIYIKGAQKRNKTDEIEHYSQLKQRYC